MTTPLLTVGLRTEQDVLAARQRSMQIARLMGFGAQDQVRIATAVSELARNVINYAESGTVAYAVGRGVPGSLEVEIADQGPGIADLSQILNGRYRSPSGLGLGILGARRLMDGFEIESVPRHGTRILLRKQVPSGALPLDAARLALFAEELARGLPSAGLSEVRLQNQELLRALEELRRRHEEIARLNREIEETNRGVLALYAELDERAEHLRRADQMKSRFLSHMSHEFRTPLNSIMAISRMLQERTDGELSAEQEKQVAFVRKASEDLSELVNDLLDLAKVEAGKIVVRAAEFDIHKLVGALRGMMRPLLSSEDVRLVVEDPPADLPALVSDEAKVSQILRNFMSNAIKFTPRGEVRLSVSQRSEANEVAFAVSDTGIGIAPEHQARIFEEFSQIDNPVQHRVKGTGLGLALSHKLAELLGGRISVESEVGRGSTFSLWLPLPAAASTAARVKERSSLSAGCVLVVDDDPATRYAVTRLVSALSAPFAEATNGAEALAEIRKERPAALLIDLVMPGLGGLEVLAALKADPEMRELPAVVTTSKLLSDDERVQLGHWRVPVLPKSALGRPEAATELRDALRRAGWTAPATVLEKP